MGRGVGMFGRVHNMSNLFNGVILALGLIFLLIFSTISTIHEIMDMDRKKQQALQASESQALGIATNEGWQQCREFYKSEQFDVLFRPVAKRELLEKCRQMLRSEGSDESEERVIKSLRRKKKIMLVDDSALLLRSMKSMLEKHYEICLAKSGEQALKLIPRENPDLILLDYEMDGMDGKSTFERMKEDEDMRWIPVVFLTSIADRKSIYDVLRSKPDGYILKPPDEEKIRETIEELIGEKIL